MAESARKRAACACRNASLIFNHAQVVLQSAQDRVRE